MSSNGGKENDDSREIVRYQKGIYRVGASTPGLEEVRRTRPRPSLEPKNLTTSVVGVCQKET